MLCSAPDPRVVTLSSGAHRIGSIRWDDLQRRRHYNNWLAYGQSKLANLMFGLRARAPARGRRRQSAAIAGRASRLLGHQSAVRRSGPCLGARPDGGFEPCLCPERGWGALPDAVRGHRADLPSGTFVGPDGLVEGRGHPHVVTGAGRAYDEEAGARLWAASEELTGVGFEFPAVAAA